MAYGDALSTAFGRLLCNSRLRFFPLHTATVIRCVVSPQPQHLGCSRGVYNPPEIWEPPQATNRGACPQLRGVWPQHWQRLHTNRPFIATYDSTDIRKPQSSVSDITFDTSGPRDTDTIMYRVGDLSLAGSESRRPERTCVTPFTRVFRDSSSTLTTLSGIPLPMFFTRRRAQRSYESVKVWKLTPPFPSRDRSALTADLNPSAVDGTTIIFSSFSWAIRPPGQDARNQAK